MQLQVSLILNTYLTLSTFADLAFFLPTGCLPLATAINKRSDHSIDHSIMTQLTKNTEAHCNSCKLKRCFDFHVLAYA